MIIDNKNFVSVETQTVNVNWGLDWHTNLPLAPWHSRFFERPMRCVKNALKKEVQTRLWRSSRPEVFCKKGGLGNFTKFTGKHLYQSLFFNKVSGLRPFFIEHLQWLLLNRPLIHFYANDSESCLTPNHLLFGKFLSMYNNVSSPLLT